MGGGILSHVSFGMIFFYYFELKLYVFVMAEKFSYK